MKTKLFLASLIFCITITVQAQIGTVWSWNFDQMGISDETMGDWTLTQAEGSDGGTTWTLKNSDYNIYYGTGEEEMVLGSEVWSTLGDYERWAITPPVDLSFYTGTKISFEYLKGLFEGSYEDYVYLYAATTPDMEAMLANGPIATVTLEGDSSDPPVMVLKEVEIPEEYNLETVYFAFVSKWEVSSGIQKNNWAIEITDVAITAQELLKGVEVAKKSFTIQQNPVAEYLELQAGNLINTENTQLSIYSTTGLLVKSAQYEPSLSVAELQSGMYFLIISNGTNTEKIKFIKK